MTSTLPTPFDRDAIDQQAHAGSAGEVNTSEVKTSLENRYTAQTGTVHLTGIQALVRMIFDRTDADSAAGLKTSSFVSGYEGSPLGGFDLELGRRKKLAEKYNVVHLPAVNEELGATAVSGSQLAATQGSLRDGVDGVVGYWYGKAPGLDRAADAFRHANVTGTHGSGGAVAIVGDDPTAKSSTVPSNSSRILADLGMPVLVPTDSSDILALGQHAAWMSRYSGLWVSLRVTTAVADGSSTVTLDGPSRAPDVANTKHTPSAMLLGKNLLSLDATRKGSRMDRVLEYAQKHSLNRLIHGSGQDRIGIIAAGAISLQVEECLRELGADGRVPEGIRVARMGMVFPLDPDEMRRFAQDLEHIIVVEELGTFLAESLKMALYDSGLRPTIHATTEARPDATMASSLPQLLDSLGADVRLPKRPARKISLPLNVASRVPHFCSGCPHNASTRVSEHTLVGAGIGCHAMVLLMDPQRVGNTIGTAQMGGEGSHWIGMAPFVTEKHIVQNMGDGTFLHSGTLALRALVASGVNATFKILHNGTVAMTGGQDPVGQPSLAGLVRMVQAENVKKIVVTTDDVARTKKQLRAINGFIGGTVAVHDRDELADIQQKLAQEKGVTVLIHDQHCAAEKRRMRGKGELNTPTTRVVINERICEGCGDCGAKSGCLSVQPVDTQFGRKTRIEQTSCNLDYSCIKGDCPAFTTVEMLPEGQHSQAASHLSKKQRRAAQVPPLDVADISAPPRSALRGKSCNVRVTGVGGTGVLTVAAVLATAAQLDGYFVRGSDMTGLAQKGGSVVSDVRISPCPIDEPGEVPRNSADLVLALDGITAAEENNLDVVNPSRTTLVSSSSESPTGVMCTDVTAARTYGMQLTSHLGSRAHKAISMDAMAVSNALLGATTFQPMVMLGAAVQSGAVPVSAQAIEQALRINGKKVELNIQAFRRGRQLVEAPEAIEELLSVQREFEKKTVVEAEPRFVDMVRHTLGGAPAELVDDIALRMNEVARWGSMSDANVYLKRVATVFEAERDFLAQQGMGELLRTAEGLELTSTFAFGLHKVTAYKDEYEVARLATNGTLENQLDVQFPHNHVVNQKIHLHPPMLRALGITSKMALGEKPTKTLIALAGMKKIRGTRLDVFGKTEVRAVERELAVVYPQRILKDVGHLASEADYHALVELAGIADSVRGYEELKVASARAALDVLRGTSTAIK